MAGAHWHPLHFIVWAATLGFFVDFLLLVKTFASTETPSRSRNSIPKAPSQEPASLSQTPKATSREPTTTHKKSPTYPEG